MVKYAILTTTLLVMTLSIFAQGTSAYWDAFYNRKRDPQTWDSISRMNDRQLENLSNPKIQKKKQVEGTTSPLSFAFNYGLKKTLGFEISGGKRVIYGIGMDYYLGQGAVGEDYSTIFSWTKYASDVYSHVTKPNLGIYAIIGHKITKKLSVEGNVGLGTNVTYHNGYDRYRILGNNGYYYTTSDGGSSILFGASIKYSEKKSGIQLGYNNFSGVKLGYIYNL